MSSADTDVALRGRELVAALRAIGPVAVAFSGGVDSALVLAAAVRALGSRSVVACTAVSASLSQVELTQARAFTDLLGVEHRLLATDELSRDGYRANSPDRCYFCKSAVLDAIGTLARELEGLAIATGTNADDAADPFRPGIRAADERGVHAPLRELGFVKREVRAVSSSWSLPTSARPASPCLASRIRHGIEVTGFRLARVERAEAAVRSTLAAADVTTTNLRVRDLGVDARVEVDSAAVAALQHLPPLYRAVADAGFAGRVEIASFSSGALSRAAAAQRAIDHSTGADTGSSQMRV